MKSAVIRITDELIQAVVPTNECCNTNYYAYAHNDGVHRITWIMNDKVQDLVGQFILVNLSTGYGPKKIALPAYRAKTHLEVKMVGISDHHRESTPLDKVLRIAPRNGTLGRKRSIASPVVIKAAVPEELAELFKIVGNGNISEGVRIAGELLRDEVESRMEACRTPVRRPPDRITPITKGVIYLFNEHSMDGGFTEMEARRMAELLSERGYLVTYGYPTSETDKPVECVADLLAAAGQAADYDPSQPLIIRPGEPHSPAVAAHIAFDECIDIISDESCNPWLAVEVMEGLLEVT